VDRAVVVLLIIGLMIIWLLSSSIGTLIKANQESSSSGAHLPMIRVGTLQPPFALPPINITIPQHVNITEASEVYVPLVPLPIIIPNMPISIANYIPTSPPRTQGTTLGGGSGSTGLQGGVGVWGLKTIRWLCLQGYRQFSLYCVGLRGYNHGHRLIMIVREYH